MNWLIALLDPGSIKRSKDPSVTKEMQGLALLIDGELGEYARMAREAEWPDFGQQAKADSDAAVRLVAALSRQLTGEARSVDELTALAGTGTQRPGFATAAAVLAGLAANDIGRADVALQVLRARLDGTEDPLEQSVLFLQLGMRQAEAGDAKRGLESTERARASIRRVSSPRRITDVLRAVALRNEFAIGWLLGQPPPWPGRLHSELLDEIELRATAGLDAFLTGEFTRRVEDPTTQTFTIRSEDPVESPLIGCLLRSESIGDWSLTRASRKRLGRYQLIASLGDRSRNPDAAFHMLRRADDTDGLKRAGRLYRFQGPLVPLRAAGEAVVQSPWLRSELAGNLVLLAETADAVRPDLAYAALVRLIEGADDFLGHVGRHRTESDFMSALAGLISVAELPEYDTASAWLREIVTAGESSILTQSVAVPVAALPWHRLTASEREAWAAFASEHLGVPDDRRFVANSAAIGLTEAGDRDILAHLLAAFERSPALDLGALLLSSPSGVPSRVYSQVAHLTLEAVSSIRSQAAAGSHSFGGVVDPAHVLASLLISGKARSGWRELAAFLLDSNVSGRDKTRTSDYLARHADRIPASHTKRLRRMWPIRARDLPFDPSQDLTGSAYRLALSVGALTGNEALGVLLGLGTSDDRRSRYQAALSLTFAADHGTDATNVIGLGLSLAEDGSPEVRGVAGQALPGLVRSSPEEFKELVRSRMVALLEDPGALVPTLVLRGLRRTGDADLYLVDIAQRLAGESYSSEVRAAARDYVRSTTRN